jgi:hypothetical protein
LARFAAAVALRRLILLTTRLILALAISDLLGSRFLFRAILFRHHPTRAAACHRGQQRCDPRCLRNEHCILSFQL